MYLKKVSQPVVGDGAKGATILDSEFAACLKTLYVLVFPEKSSESVLSAATASLADEQSIVHKHFHRGLSDGHSGSLVMSRVANVKLSYLQKDNVTRELESLTLPDAPVVTIDEGDSCAVVLQDRDQWATAKAACDNVAPSLAQVRDVAEKVDSVREKLARAAAAITDTYDRRRLTNDQELRTHLAADIESGALHPKRVDAKALPYLDWLSGVLARMTDTTEFALSAVWPNDKLLQFKAEAKAENDDTRALRGVVSLLSSSAPLSQDSQDIVTFYDRFIAGPAADFITPAVVDGLRRKLVETMHLDIVTCACFIGFGSFSTQYASGEIAPEKIDLSECVRVDTPEYTLVCDAYVGFTFRAVRLMSAGLVSKELVREYPCGRHVSMALLGVEALSFIAISTYLGLSPTTGLKTGDFEPRLMALSRIADTMARLEAVWKQLDVASDRFPIATKSHTSFINFMKPLLESVTKDTHSKLQVDRLTMQANVMEIVRKRPFTTVEEMITCKGNKITKKDWETVYKDIMACEAQVSPGAGPEPGPGRGRDRAGAGAGPEPGKGRAGAGPGPVPGRAGPSETTP